MSFISRLWPAAPHAAGETRSGFLAPASHRLVGDENPAFSQEQLDIAQAEAEDPVQPNSAADDLGGEPVGRKGRVAASRHQSLPPSDRQPDVVTVTIPARPT